MIQESLVGVDTSLAEAAFFAPGSSIPASVIESESNTTSLERILYALNWLVSEIIQPDTANLPTLLNMSLAFEPSSVSTGQNYQYVMHMRSLLNTLVNGLDLLPIVASGNSGAGNLLIPGYLPEVLSVGAVDFNLQPTLFTSSGQKTVDGKQRIVPDVWGYGSEVYSSFERNNNNRSVYATLSGTSMAAPYVTGIAALYAQQTGLQGNALKRHVIQNAIGYPNVAVFV